MVGSEKLGVRLGGIYALERIAQDSPKDHWTVIEVLTAWVREHSALVLRGQSEAPVDETVVNPDARPVRTDVQAAVAVIGRRKWARNEDSMQRLDLSGAWLPKAELAGANLSNADLSAANLFLADLRASDLSGAYLSSANLCMALLREARLVGAFLDNANLYRAYLEGANICGAQLSAADLREARLYGANLAGARNRTWDQIAQTYMDESTVLPEELRERWKQEQAREKETKGSRRSDAVG
jgi:hypothetical protein